MGTRRLAILAVVAAVSLGCSASSLKAQKDDGWAHVSQSLPDGKYIYDPALQTLSTLPDPTWTGFDSNPSAYGHPFRPLGFVFYPIGVALDWVVMKPLYLLGGLAPEWFGLNADDAWTYRERMPELIISKDAPRGYRME
jgi:hypothetical protein